MFRDQVDKIGVSIIIPCYNDGRYIKEAIDSVYAQNLEIPFEILVIDDGSTDPATIKLLSLLKTDYRDLQFFRHDRNAGVSVARNTGLSNAAYSYILCIDADNRLSTDAALLKNGSYIERALTILEKDPCIFMAYCQGDVFEAQTGCWGLWPYDEKIFLIRNMLNTHSIYRKNDALAINGYRSGMNYMEDWEFAARLLDHYLFDKKLPASAKQISQPLFQYRIRQDKSSACDTIQSYDNKLNAFKIMVENNSRLYQKHFPGKKINEIPQILMDYQIPLPTTVKVHLQIMAKNPSSIGSMGPQLLSDLFNHAGIGGIMPYLVKIKHFLKGAPAMEKPLMDDEAEKITINTRELEN